jgi:hypothetical protein
MGKYFRLLVVGILLSSCSVETIEEISDPIIPTLQLDGRLPIDKNGYYHLVLDSTRNQTIHRVSGKVLNTLEPTKVSWESNLYWWLRDGDTIANITKTYINYFTGELTYVNLPPLINWKDYIVPTINPASYVDKNGEINTMIAPIYRMKNDTLVVKCEVNEWDITQTIKIVLE